MKLKSLLLGSAAAVALSSSAFAADATAPVMSLDICDALSMQGVTISGSANADDVETCLVISGEVAFEFVIEFNDDFAGDGGFGSHLEEIDLDFKAVSETTEYGPAVAFISLTADGLSGDNYYGSLVHIDEAYVQVGGFVTGLTGSIFNDDDDEPHVYGGLYMSDGVDDGVEVGYFPGDSKVIQYVHDLGDGITVSVGLEDLYYNDLNDDNYGGDFVGVISADQDWGTAHLSVAALNMLGGDDGQGVSVHTGATIKMDAAEVVIAAAFTSGSYYSNNSWSVLGSVSIPLDDVTFALSGNAYEYSGSSEFDLGASLVFTGVEGVTLSLGAAYTSLNFLGDDHGWKIAAKGEFDVADDLTASLELSRDYGNTVTLAGDLNFTPGGGYEANLGVDFVSPDSADSYVVTKLETSKTF